MELFKLIIFTLSQFSKQVNNFCHESGGSFLFVLYELARSQFSLLRRLNDSLKKGKASSPDRKILPPPLRLAAFVKFESKKGIPKRHSVMIRYTTVVPISAHFSMSASLEVRSLIRKTVVYVSVLQLFFFFMWVYSSSNEWSQNFVMIVVWLVVLTKNDPETTSPFSSPLDSF